MTYQINDCALSTRGLNKKDFRNLKKIDISVKILKIPIKRITTSIKSKAYYLRQTNGNGQIGSG